jgi:hypothetical protein
MLGTIDRCADPVTVLARLVKRDVESSAVVNPSQRRFADWATSNQALLEGLQ